MATTLETSVKLTLTSTLVKTMALLTQGLQAPLQINETQTFHTGTATGLADRLFFDQRTLAASATENLDLAGTLTDAFGATTTFVFVKGIYIKAAAANTNTVIVGNGTAPFIGPFGAAGASEQRLPPGGIYLVTHPTTGWGVTATTADILKVLNGGAGTPVTYDVAIWGTSA